MQLLHGKEPPRVDPQAGCGVGRAGEKPALTRFGDLFEDQKTSGWTLYGIPTNYYKEHLRAWMINHGLPWVLPLI